MSDRSSSPPIPEGENYHTGAVNGNIHHMLRIESAPNLSQQVDGTLSPQTAGSISSHPLYPKRFNDDSTDHGHHMSPQLLFQIARSKSNPQTPTAALAPDGETGCAPTIPPIAPAPFSLAGSATSSPNIVSVSSSTPPLSSQSPPTASALPTPALQHSSSLGSISMIEAVPPPGCGCGRPHKSRFDHATTDEEIDLPERDSHEVPFHRPVFEKDANGLFQMGLEPTSIFRSKSGASLNPPPSVGPGPRAPPAALVSGKSTIAKPNFGRSHEKLPYNRITIDYAPFQPSAEATEIAIHIRKCLELRTKFVWTPLRDETEYDIFDTPVYTPPSLNHSIPPKASNIHFGFHEGVFSSWVVPAGTSTSASGSDPMSTLENATQVFAAPNRKEFGIAMGVVMDLVISGPAKTFCHNRLHIMEARFNLHELLNHDIEQHIQKSVPHRDFYNVRKIDNHVHASAMMNQKHLLRYIKYKLKQDSDEIVIIRDGKKLTLPEVFQSLNITAYDLSVDTLDMHADKTFHRFDKFNLKYNPVGESRLREIFLKYNNYIKGKYLAELTKQVFDDLESNKYQFAEYRLSIYGSKKDEWAALADWIVDHQLFSSNIRWMIQIPRLYSIYKASGQIKNFAEMLFNIFNPLFEVTLDPTSNPKLHLFLQSCVGFDMVDDESLRERPFNESLPTPEEWTYEYDPPYALFAYYLYANICALNKLRVYRGMSSFSFRPHSGEAGDIEHLAATFLLAKSINHGIMLQKSPALQYLYYLAQIGISMSPLSNNLLFLEYEKNPFVKFFKKGLNVTLSTDDPLMIHVTKEPLVEEYSVAAQVWKLSAIDLCETARNSVLQSGFEQRFKAHWIGNNYWRRDYRANDIRQTNIPDVRIQFRAELLGDEFKLLQKHSGLPFTEALIDRIM